MRRTQLYLDDDLWDALHAQAILGRTSISELVRKAARDLGRDDNEERFEDALRTVAKAKRSGQKVGRDSTSKDHGKLAEDGE